MGQPVVTCLTLWTTQHPSFPSLTFIHRTFRFLHLMGGNLTVTCSNEICRCLTTSGDMKPKVQISGGIVTSNFAAQSRFSQMHNIGNNGIKVNFLLLYIYSFLLYFHQMRFADVKFNLKGFGDMYSKVAIFIDLVHF